MAAGLLDKSVLTTKSNTGAASRSVGDNELASNQLDNLTRKDSPLSQRAYAAGKDYGTSRGMVNSSITGGRAEGEFIDRVTPFAIEDARRHGNVADQNLAYKNQFLFEDKKFGNQGLLQKDNHAWRSGENTADRSLQKTLQGNEFEFRGGENEADRALQKTLQGNEFGWRSGENQLDRSFQTSERKGTQQFAAGESAKDRALTMDENEKSRRLEKYLQTTEQDWRTGESAKDRMLTMSESEKNRLLEKSLQEEDQAFRSAENEFDRVLSQALQNDQQQFASGENQADRQFDAGENAEERAFRERLLESDQDFTASQSALDRTETRENREAQRDHDYRIEAQRAERELERMGFALEINSQNMSAQALSNLYLNAQNNIAQILGDPNLDPDAKKGAIDNVKKTTEDTAKVVEESNKTDVPKTPQTPKGPATGEEVVAQNMVQHATSLGYKPTDQEFAEATLLARQNNWTLAEGRQFVEEEMKRRNL